MSTGIFLFSSRKPGNCSAITIVHVKRLEFETYGRLIFKFIIVCKNYRPKPTSICQFLIIYHHSINMSHDLKFSTLPIKYLKIAKYRPETPTDFLPSNSPFYAFRPKSKVQYNCFSDVEEIFGEMRKGERNRLIWMS